MAKAKIDKKVKSKATAGDYKVIIKPVFTEKSTLLSSAEKSAVAFRVAKGSSKDAIRQAVERIFSVEVESVRTINYMGKLKRMGSSVGRRDGYKKAYVTLKAGNTIDLVEGL